MSKKTDEKKDFSIKKILVLVILFLMIIIFFMLIKPFNDWSFHPDAELFGQFGNFIGGLFGTMVSLLAAFFLYQTLISQKKSIEQQEIQMFNQRKSFDIERFETTFFNLLKTQREIKNEISEVFYFFDDQFNVTEYSCNGMIFFKDSIKKISEIWRSLNTNEYEGIYDEDYQNVMSSRLDELEDPEKYSLEAKNKIFANAEIALINNFYKIYKSNWEAQKSKNSLERTQVTINIFIERHYNVIGQYLSNFNSVLKFVTTNDIFKDDQEKKKYVDLFRFQLSLSELVLLFYYTSIHKELGEILPKYGFFSGLSLEDLVDKSHNCIPGIDLKNRTELINSLDYKS